MPTPTDLVTDLPADFEVFGQAVDTAMADLKGGTTGQVLSKTTNADMDFTWVAANPGDITGVTAGTGISGGGTSGTVTVTNSMATAITTAGDLIKGTGSGTFDRLGIGSTGQVLTVTAGAPAWETASSGSSYVAGKNGVLNSQFNVWQRGTSVGVAFNYTADRWKCYQVASAATSSRSTDTATGFQYSMKMQRNSGSTSTGDVLLTQSFESINSYQYQGKTVSFSFYAKAGANYSAASSALKILLKSSTGIDQEIISAWAGSVDVVNTTATLTTSWQRFTYTGSVPSNSSQLGMDIRYTPVGTAGADDAFYITGVQVEIASAATSYSPNTSTQALELAACQRYYYQPTTGVYWNGYATSGVNFYTMVYLPIAMRTAPTVTNTSIVAGNFPATASSASSIGTTSFVNARIASGTGAGGYADTYTASSEL